MQHNTDSHDAEFHEDILGFDLNDRKGFKNALDEFKLRHNSIASQTAVINEQLDKLLEDLEQNIVLGYVDRKEIGIHNIKMLDKNDVIPTKRKVISEKPEDNKESNFKRLIELSQTLSKEKDLEVDLKRHIRKQDFIE
jgi:hypothetical protein